MSSQIETSVGIDTPKYSCALAGAYATVTSISRVVPILHSGPGCAQAATIGYTFAAGWQGAGYIGGMATPCSNLCEKDVVFGGNQRLEEQIKGTLDIIDGDLYVVISGCIPSMLGDDVESVIQKFDKVPILHVNAAGFASNSYYGYARVLNAFIDQLLEKAVEKEEGLVNIVGIVPQQHIFWNGDLHEIKRLLGKVGLNANIIFDGGIDNLRKIPKAELTIVLSPWVGIDIAKKLEEKFEIPYLVFPGLPVGPQETERFITAIADKLHLSQELVTKTIEEERKEAYKEFDLAYDVMVFFQSLACAVVADSTYAVGFTRFLANEAGLAPTITIVTDNPPDEYREEIKNKLADLNSGVKPEVFFESDAHRIREILKKRNFAVLYATSMEKYLATQLNAAHLSISFPAYDRLIVKRTYAGFGGGISLLEDIVGKVAMPF